MARGYPIAVFSSTARVANAVNKVARRRSRVLPAPQRSQRRMPPRTPSLGRDRVLSHSGEAVGLNEVDHVGGGLQHHGLILARPV